jgi:hypothetical protein
MYWGFAIKQSVGFRYADMHDVASQLGHYQSKLTDEFYSMTIIFSKT